MAMKALNSPSSERNKGPIGEVLKEYLGKDDTMAQRLLEIASGYGTHVMYFSSLFPNVIFHPTEYDVGSISSITAHLENEALANRRRTNVASPVRLDVSQPADSWPTEIRCHAGNYDFVFNANMVHISPWKCTLGLFAGSSAMLKKGGRLIMYGPFAFDGVLEPQSNIEFDNSLKLNNAEWGIRDVADIEQVAAKENFVLVTKHDMPANNKILVWEKI